MARPWPYRGATAVVTGASSGLGAEFARRLADRGCHLVLVARRVDRLEALAAELGARAGVTATVLPADLARPGAAAEVAAELESRLDGRPVDMLVANAGFGLHGALVEADADRVAEMLQLNVVTLVGLTHALLPGMVARRRGAVVTVASTAAYQPTPYLAAYGASKAFVLSFTEAVAAEVRGSGVRVLAVSPGPTATEFFDTAGAGAAVGRVQTAGAVVAEALRALDRGRPASVLTTTANRLQATGARLVPRSVAVELSRRLLRPRT